MSTPFHIMALIAMVCYWPPPCARMQHAQLAAGTALLCATRGCTAPSAAPIHMRLLNNSSSNTSLPALSHRCSQQALPTAADVGAVPGGCSCSHPGHPDPALGTPPGLTTPPSAQNPAATVAAPPTFYAGAAAACCADWVPAVLYAPAQCAVHTTPGPTAASCLHAQANTHICCCWPRRRAATGDVAPGDTHAVAG
jgi:hypothetical protein